MTRSEVEWAQEELLAAFAEALAGADVPDRQRPRPSGAERLRIVRAVESYLESHLGETLRIDDLCSTVGTNLHTLERAFAEVQGISPKRFLTFRRLALARKDLLRAAPGSTSVTDVATHWGFFHLSRFAAEYKALFHESPSETLLRVRSRAGFRGTAFGVTMSNSGLNSSSMAEQLLRASRRCPAILTLPSPAACAKVFCRSVIASSVERFSVIVASASAACLPIACVSTEFSRFMRTCCFVSGSTQLITIRLPSAFAGSRRTAR